MTPNEDRIKRCTGCRYPLPLWAFGKQTCRTDGRRSICNECRKERRRQLWHGAKRHRPWTLKKTFKSKIRYQLAEGVYPELVRKRVEYSDWTMERACTTPKMQPFGKEIR